jgi:hypothetical protein
MFCCQNFLTAASLGQNAPFYLSKILIILNLILNLKFKKRKEHQGWGVASHPILPRGGSATP